MQLQIARLYGGSIKLLTKGSIFIIALLSIVSKLLPQADIDKKIP
jgi:hypothetical protein